MRRINEALRLAVPQLQELTLDRDDEGLPHLVASYQHWRPHGARQDERDFSDGTLRLIGLLWALQEGGSQLSDRSCSKSRSSRCTRRSSRRCRRCCTGPHTADARCSSARTQSRFSKTKGWAWTRSCCCSQTVRERESRSRADLGDDVRGEIEAGLTLAEAVLPRTAPDRLEQLALAVL